MVVAPGRYPRSMGGSSGSSTARLLLLLAEFGQTIGRGMVAAGGEPDLVGNAPIIVLSAIDLDGPQRPNALQRRTGLSSGGLSKLLDRMEQLGVVRRERGAVSGDRRGVLVVLTDRGRDHLRMLTDSLAERLPETRAFLAEIARAVEA